MIMHCISRRDVYVGLRTGETLRRGDSKSSGQVSTMTALRNCIAQLFSSITRYIRQRLNCFVQSVELLSSFNMHQGSTQVYCSQPYWLVTG
jgi:hypothetical protein